jgi:hypothetical protein
LTVEEEEERLLNLKRQRLATAELLDTPDQQHKTEESPNDGFLAQLTTKVVNNLQFTIKNIHIRYEDKISDPGHPFAVGVTLKELSGLSTDDDWQPKFISDPTSSINKVGYKIVIECVCHYLPYSFSLSHLNLYRSIGIRIQSLWPVCIMKKLPKYLRNW